MEKSKDTNWCPFFLAYRKRKLAYFVRYQRIFLQHIEFNE